MPFEVFAAVARAVRCHDLTSRDETAASDLIVIRAAGSDRCHIAVIPHGLDPDRHPIRQVKTCKNTSRLRCLRRRGFAGGDADVHRSGPVRIAIRVARWRCAFASDRGPSHAPKGEPDPDAALRSTTTPLTASVWRETPQKPHVCSLVSIDSFRSPERLLARQDTRNTTPTRLAAGKAIGRMIVIPPDPATNIKFSVSQRLRADGDVAGILIIPSERLRRRGASLRGCLLGFSLDWRQ